MLRLLTAIGTLFSLFSSITAGPKTRPLRDYAATSRWSLAVKANNQFDNWT